MGHGFYTVVDYGVAIPADEFHSRFPGEVENSLRVFEHENAYYVFLTRGNPCVQQYTRDESMSINEVHLLSEPSPELRSFVRRYFPEYPIKLMVCTYDEY